MECDNFNYIEHYGQEHFDRAREQIAEKVRGLICKEHNMHIQSNLESFLSKGYSMTKKSFSKLEHIVSKFGEQVKKIKQPPQEIALYLLADIPDILENNPIVNDVFIAHDQKVFPGFVEIKGIGDIKSLREIRGLKKKVVGWGHSHGQHGTFFSSTDRNTIDKFLDDNKTFSRIDLEHYGHKHKLSLGYTYGLVINERKSRPFVAVNVDYPEYEVSDGKIIKTKKKKYVPKLSLNKIKSERYAPSKEEDGNIVNTLRDRILIGGKKLGEHMPLIPKVLDKVKKVKERIKEITPSVETLKDKYNDLKQKYHTSLARTKSLEEQNRYLQLTCGQRTYSEQMKDIYTNNHAKSDAKLISKILSGQFRGDLESIAKGDYSEDISNYPIWSWSDRMQSLEKADFKGLEKVERRRIKDIIKSNSYLKKNYRENYQRLTKMLT